VKFAAAPLTVARARELGEEAKAIVREERARAAAEAQPEQAAA
jgi:hypothetical protein